MNNHSYIVRVWLEPNPGGSSLWRASVLEVNSQERWFFSSADRLAAFLFEMGDGKREMKLESEVTGGTFKTLHDP